MVFLNNDPCSNIGDWVAAADYIIEKSDVNTVV